MTTWPTKRGGARGSHINRDTEGSRRGTNEKSEMAGPGSPGGCPYRVSIARSLFPGPRHLLLVQ